MEHEALDAVLVLLALSVVAVALLRRLNLPPILGYLLVGALAGPHSLGWVPHSELIQVVAEIGVVFLLFTIGLEFSIPHVIALRGAVFGLGGTQVVLYTAAGGLVAWLLGMSWQGALVVGGALAMSSTAIAVKQLTEQLEMQSRHGRLGLGVLLFQDLAVVPFFVVIPMLAYGSGEAFVGSLLLALAKGIAAFLVLLAAGHWALRPLFHTVATVRSAELFTLTALLVALAAAWLTNLMGLSLALGAFLAGMMLGETEYRHQVETDIRPFRDVLMGLFFISVGTQLQMAGLPGIWHWVVLLVMALMVGKAALVAGLTRVLGYEGGVALRTGLVLGQGGEFGFAMLAMAVAYGLVEPANSQALLAAIVISMALAPVLIRHNGAIAKRVFANSYLKGRRLQEQQLDSAAKRLDAHVIICGFGRIGQNLARFLRIEGVAYVALDLDPVLIKEAWEAGETVFYGDSSHAEILEAAGLPRARAVVITFDEATTATRIIHAARALCSQTPIIARTRDDRHLEELEDAGASDVVPESVEASMMLAGYLLRRLDVPMEEVMYLVERARNDHYQGLRGFFHGREPETVEEVDRYRLHTVVLPPASYAVGRNLGALGLPDVGVRASAVCRSGIRGEDPTPAMVLQAGDAVVLQGAQEGLERAEERLLRG
jgi:CPA2 family monovalent cation:H+ antiporter-2